jgi:hypothetical protein
MIPDDLLHLFGPASACDCTGWQVVGVLLLPVALVLAPLVFVLLDIGREWVGGFLSAGE